jgi:hypothetical protein
MAERRRLNLFYEEPDPDRWLPFDRHPRRIVRRLLRGPTQPGGMERAFLNLRAGLDRLGAQYRVNDYRYISQNSAELACVFGKPHVLAKVPDQTPLLFGTSIYSHPSDDPLLPLRRPIRQVLVPSAWVQRMFSTVWPGRVSVWACGVDTDRWAPGPARDKDIDVLIYDKIFWQRPHYERSVVVPVREELRRRGLRAETIRYGSYREQEFVDLGRRSRSMIFLSRHETQGIAAQQVMSMDVPLLAWDEGGYWQDPKYYPEHVKFEPVTSVPYWDDRCGRKFKGGPDFRDEFALFWTEVQRGAYAPRQMILEDFTLAKRAAAYLDLVDAYGRGESWSGNTD